MKNKTEKYEDAYELVELINVIRYGEEDSHRGIKN